MVVKSQLILREIWEQHIEFKKIDFFFTSTHTHISLVLMSDTDSDVIIAIDNGWYSFDNVHKLWSAYRCFDEECLNQHPQLSPSLINLSSDKKEELKLLMSSDEYQFLRKIFKIITIDNCEYLVRFCPSNITKSITQITWFILLMTIIQMSCSTSHKSDQIVKATSSLDTLKYDKNDYDLMRAYFN